MVSTRLFTLHKTDLSQVVDQFSLAFQPKLTHCAAPLRTNGFDAALQTFRNADQRQATRVQLENLPFAGAQYPGATGNVDEFVAQQRPRVLGDETSAIDNLDNRLVQRFHAIAFVDEAVYAQFQQAGQHLRLRDHGHNDHARPLCLPQETS